MYRAPITKILQLSFTMSLSTQDADEDEQYILVAKLDNARTLSNILKAIHFKDVSMTARNCMIELIVIPYRPQPSLFHT